MPKKARYMTETEMNSALERSRQIREEIERNRVSMTAVSYYMGCSYPTLWRKLKAGLTEEDYFLLIRCIGAAVTTRQAAAERR